MPLKSSVLFVRHGEYSHDTGELTSIGREQVQEALGKIAAFGYGADALVVSSNAPRAVQTAGIIGEGIGCSAISVSRRLNEAGHHPATIRSLDTILGEELILPNLHSIASRGLVVVTHGPLVAAARGMAHADMDQAAPFGGVFPYSPGDWVNPFQQPR